MKMAARSPCPAKSPTANQSTPEMSEAKKKSAVYAVAGRDVALMAKRGLTRSREEIPVAITSLCSDGRSASFARSISKLAGLDEIVEPDLVDVTNASSIPAGGKTEDLCGS